MLALFGSARLSCKFKLADFLPPVSTRSSQLPGVTEPSFPPSSLAMIRWRLTTPLCRPGGISEEMETCCVGDCARQAPLMVATNASARNLCGLIMNTPKPGNRLLGEGSPKFCGLRVDWVRFVISLFAVSFGSSFTDRIVCLIKYSVLPGWL